VVEAVAKKGEAGDAEVEASVRSRVADLCRRFPIYP
jgi:glycine hydroxymethyltransferase